MGPKIDFPFVKFNNGICFPAFGLGTWGSKGQKVTEVINYAIDIGYRHFDCASVYLNEKYIGNAIAQKLKEGHIKREDIYITSKLWNTHHSKCYILPALKKTLNDLRIDYIDLYLIHWPMAYKDGDVLFPMGKNKKILYGDTKFTETWKELEKYVCQGLIKSIGVANFNSKQLEELMKEAKIKPVNNQVECHPYLTQRKLQEYCNSKDIVLTAYSPLGSPARPWVKVGDPVVLEDKTLKEIAKKYKKDVAQILIRYQIERGNIVIPKSETKIRIESNSKIFDFDLCCDDIEEIDELNINERFVHLKNVRDHKDYPFNIEY
ncbi:aldo-keto reductase 1B-like [Lycorma delicatula]|uniref:aldo-keto reductase 1B-like n=1 Tax=Lycorma delicatula TaxID=130591 RepID=UPI003F511C54